MFPIRVNTSSGVAENAWYYEPLHDRPSEGRWNPDPGESRIRSGNVTLRVARFSASCLNRSSGGVNLIVFLNLDVQRHFVGTADRRIDGRNSIGVTVALLDVLCQQHEILCGRLVRRLPVWHYRYLARGKKRKVADVAADIDDERIGWKRQVASIRLVEEDSPG